jgi:hypothetical protein
MAGEQETAARAVKAGSGRRPGVYRRVTVYLTEEEYAWLRRTALEAALKDVPLSVSDLVRLAVDDLSSRSEELLGRAVAHVREEVLE